MQGCAEIRGAGYQTHHFLPMLYYQVPNQCPPLFINFQFFATSPDFIRSPHLLLLRKLTFCSNPSFHFLSLLVLSTPNLHGKIADCCIHSSFMPNDNLFLFFSPLYNHAKPVLKVRPPVNLDSPIYHNLECFPTPLFIRTPLSVKAGMVHITHRFLQNLVEYITRLQSKFLFHYFVVLIYLGLSNHFS